MSGTTSSPKMIDRRLAGEPVQIGGYRVQQVARLRGRLGAGGNAQGSGAGGHFSLEPVEALVRTVDGVESRVALADPSTQALRALTGAAGAVAMVSLASILLARLWPRLRRHQPSQLN